MQFVWRSRLLPEPGRQPARKKIEPVAKLRKRVSPTEIVVMRTRHWYEKLSQRR
jgi:hypothetical protein